MKKITDIKGTFRLHNDVKIPYLGLGTYQAESGDEVISAVKYALETGYRHIDTASYYDNEEGVGQGIKESQVPREEIFVTTKVWNSDQGHDSTLKAFDASINKLGLDYLDLYLVHWPVVGKYKETYRALEQLYNDGRIRAIGVSNFLQHHIEDLLQHCQVRPMVNQCEFHPRLVQRELQNFCKCENIQYQAWSPLMQGGIFKIDTINALAEKYQKDAAQITVRYALQKGIVTIPKSTSEGHIKSNADVFDFEISSEDIQKLDALDQHYRTGPDPDHVDF
ncbi:MAG: aldo/keto reductase [Leeuwenhoekiella sp.]